MSKREPPTMLVTRGPLGTLSGTCPHCGGAHTHGDGGSEGPDFGHRVAHCKNPGERNDGYFLRLKGQVPKR